MNLFQKLKGRFSKTEEKAKFSLPIILEVKVLNHCYCCGFHIEGDRQYVVTVEPTDEEMRKRYGIFDVYSETVHRMFRDGEITKLPFVDNPRFEPESVDEPLLILYTHPSDSSECH